MTHREKMKAMMLDKARNLDEALYNLKCYINECDSYPDWIKKQERSLNKQREEAWANYYTL